MKVKNIAFSGFMAAILMGATATAANAAISVASKDYVDSKSAAIATATINTEMAATGVIGSKIKETDDKAVAAQTAVDTLAGNVYTKEAADAKFELIGVAAAKAEEVATNAQNYTNTKIQELSDKLVGGGEGGEVGLESKVASNTLAIEALDGRADTLEGLVGTTSVATQIAESLKTYSTTEQVDSKDAATLQSAKEYADGKVNALDLTAAAEAGKYVSTVAQADGQISQTLVEFAGDVETGGVNAPTSAAVVTYVDGELSAVTTAATNLEARVTALDSEAEASKGRVTLLEEDIDSLTETKQDNLVSTASVTVADNNEVSVNFGAVDASNTTTAVTGSAVDGAIATAKAAAIADAEGKVNALASGAVATNTKDIADINTELTTKITMPAVCDKTTCVLTYDSATQSPVWVPLTDPVADFM